MTLFPLSKVVTVSGEVCNMLLDISKRSTSKCIILNFFHLTYFFILELHAKLVREIGEDEIAKKVFFAYPSIITTIRGNRSFLSFLDNKVSNFFTCDKNSIRLSIKFD